MNLPAGQPTRCAVVTGGARGIGRAAALRLAADGFHVVVADTDPSAGAATCADIQTEYGIESANFVRTDVNDPDDIEALRRLLQAMQLPVTGLVNAAGTTSRVPFFEMTRQEGARVTNVNRTATFFVGQAVAKVMVERRVPGGIVNLASVNSDVVRHPDHSVYTATKAGVVGLTKAMAVSLAPCRIRVNAVAPGPINTELLAQRMRQEGGTQHILRNVLLGRVGEPAEVASLISFLLSDAAAYMTGVSVPIDGGLLVGAAPRASEGAGVEEGAAR
jgi:NAD(P)-dependent dehydrogenase (short-subunit alcohol dehydrogenase family)